MMRKESPVLLFPVDMEIIKLDGMTLIHLDKQILAYTRKLTQDDIDFAVKLRDKKKGA